MRSISQNENAIFEQSRRDASQLALANWLALLRRRNKTNSREKKRASERIKIRTLNMPLNVWTFLIESINDAIKN